MVGWPFAFMIVGVAFAVAFLLVGLVWAGNRRG
jgi:uncharacterized membrane protein